MNPLLATLGGKLTERWLNSLVLPGALFLATTAVGTVMGHRHWHDVDRLRTTLDELAAHPALDRTGTAALLVTFFLLAATAASLGAQFLGNAIERWQLRFGRDPFSRARTTRRALRWRQRDAERTLAIEHAHRAGTGPGGAGTSANAALTRVQALTEARDRIALREPARPTWYGDRMQAAADRVEAAYGVDLAVLWPRVWLILPEPAVRRVQSAHDSFSSAARLAAWAVGYALLACWWWPAALAAVGCALVARSRARSALEALAELIEAAVDVHGLELATRIGLLSPETPPGRLTQDTGDDMSALFRKAE
ncbi:hypothetical protein ACOZEM_31685 [Streptomyces cellulosae]|jgi:hypothetical protein|uniref:hypothetical protein n=1 Tax=unclassified Streptomyces TaxID=2593676 RepID=UPI00035FAAF8|nr:hypothetical protein [Streptomyces sp. MD20-1-1]MYW52577.1 hypothetical protein [Streptomyces sp. SID8376]